MRAVEMHCMLGVMAMAWVNTLHLAFWPGCPCVLMTRLSCNVHVTIVARDIHTCNVCIDTGVIHYLHLRGLVAATSQLFRDKAAPLFDALVLQTIRILATANSTSKATRAS